MSHQNLWTASSDNNIALVKSLIGAGVHTPNDRDPNGYTPIHAAASYGHIDLLRYLITEAGGDVNIKDDDDETALFVAETADVAKALVEEFKIDYHHKNSDGQTAAEKIEEEDEFTEVSSYLKSLENGTAPATTSAAPAPQVRYSYENSEDMHMADGDDEYQKLQRERIERILSSDNPEAGMRELVEDAVRLQLNPESAERHVRRKL
ncbi:ankyrin repeat-containing domain protein [Dipodascopsis tothii]|uniref:ankyrin repeat-containing domain protein n=1 Tax=Dipodascopsis tothii TaxID=44089 RepID=UPI0034CFD51E